MDKRSSVATAASLSTEQESQGQTCSRPLEWPWEVSVSLVVYGWAQLLPIPGSTFAADGMFCLLADVRLVHLGSQLAFWAIKGSQSRGKLSFASSTRQQEIGNSIQETTLYSKKGCGGKAMRPTDLKVTEC